MRTFPKTIYPVGELSSISAIIVNLYEENEIHDEFFLEVVPLIKVTNEKLTALLLKSTSPELNEKLSAADQNRDASFIRFRDYCRVFEHYHIPAKSRAALKITNLIRDIGWKMYNTGYAEENIKLTRLINKLETTDYTNAVITIGANFLFDILKESQKEFEDIYEKEVLANINSTDYPEIREAKKDVGDYLESLISYTAIKAELHKKRYGFLYEKIDEIIAESSPSYSGSLPQ